DQGEGLGGGIEADQEVGEVAIEDQRVTAASAVDDVAASAAVEDVVAGAADQGIVAEPAGQVFHIAVEGEDGAAGAVIDDLADDVLEHKAPRRRAVGSDDTGLEIGVEAAELALEGEGVDAVAARDDIGTCLGRGPVRIDGSGSQAGDEVAIDLGIGRTVETAPQEVIAIASQELVLAESADQGVIAEATH